MSEHLDSRLEPEQQSKLSPRVYVASLSDYNAGRLHGAWINADQPADGLQVAVSEMLAASPEPIAEEWAIHDYEDFGSVRLSEYEDLVSVSRLGRGIAKHGRPFAAWAATRDSFDGEALDEFEEGYLGTYDSIEAYAEQLLDDVGATAELSKVPEWLQPYLSLDVAAFANDLVLGGDVRAVADDEGVHVFDGRM
jgi:antirestriction protein